LNHEKVIYHNDGRNDRHRSKCSVQHQLSFASIRYVRGATTLLHRICHQILTAYEAENGNVVVFVKNS
jgi:hypothetical protein